MRARAFNKETLTPFRGRNKSPEAERFPRAGREKKGRRGGERETEREKKFPSRLRLRYTERQ